MPSCRPRMSARSFFLFLCCVSFGLYSSVVRTRSEAATTTPEAESHSLNGTVFYDTSSQSYSVVLGSLDCETGLACGYFNDSLNMTGFGMLEVMTKVSASQPTGVSDVNRMYAAGYLEGYLSSFEIDTYYTIAWMNNREFLFAFLPDFRRWFNQQTAWIEAQIAANAGHSPYWQYMQVLQAQFNGLVEGYNAAAHKYGLQRLTAFELNWMNAMEDYFDLIEILVFGPLSNASLSDAKSEAYRKFGDSSRGRKRGFGHCSGLVKVTPTLDNLYFAHDTWTDYYTMNRVYKHYIFELAANFSCKHMSFSSYPAVLSSIDDYYVMDSGLASMETTNFQLNPELWKHCNSSQLFVWQRVRIANQLASNGPQWISLFSQHNSGTYNNQWMILDYKLFQVGQPLADGLLWIAEQIPGNVSSMDATGVLERGYWASYNVPAIEYVYDKTGNKAYAALRGPSESYDLAPRARIFRRDGNSATQLAEMQRLMRYNNYQNDALENNNPTWAIMNRRDLEGHLTFGGTDTKLANLTMLQTMNVMVRAGPTNDDLPTFTWTDFEHVYHYGLPISYDFQWFETKSKLKL